MDLLTDRFPFLHWCLGSGVRRETVNFIITHYYFHFLMVAFWSFQNSICNNSKLTSKLTCDMSSSFWKMHAVSKHCLEESNRMTRIINPWIQPLIWDRANVFDSPEWLQRSSSTRMSHCAAVLRIFSSLSKTSTSHPSVFLGYILNTSERFKSFNPTIFTEKLEN